MHKLRWLETAVQNLALGAAKPVQRLFRDWVLGSIVAGRVVLSAIARALRADKKGFEAALERLSRGLGAQNLGSIEQLGHRYLGRVRRWVCGAFYVVAIDLSDIIKPYARKMPYLCDLRDGSKSTRLETVIGRGWGTVEIVAVDDRHRVLPLHRHPFSTEHPDFKSETNELRRALERLRSVLGAEAWAVLDRGFDGHNEFALLDEFFERWCVRQRGDRQVYRPGNDRPIRMMTLAKRLQPDLVAYPRHSRDGKLVKTPERFAYCTIEVPLKPSHTSRRKPACERRGLIVVHREHDDAPPMILLVRRSPRSPSEARRWVEAYHRRWSCEEQTRLAKQSVDLEDLRVLRWEAIVNLLALTVLTEGLLALVQVERPRRAKRLARLAPIDGEAPPFALYRIWMTVALMLLGRLAATR